MPSTLPLIEIPTLTDAVSDLALAFVTQTNGVTGLAFALKRSGDALALKPLTDAETGLETAFKTLTNASTDLVL